MVEEVKIKTEHIKLDQFLKWQGLVQTGAEAKDYIINGRVMVNEQITKERGKKIRPGDIVKVAGIGEFKCI